MFSKSLIMQLPTALSVTKRSFHISHIKNEIQKMTRLRVVDNSDIGRQAMAEGKPPKCIHVYNRTGIGLIGVYFGYLYITK